jgi:hypothetical protein
MWMMSVKTGEHDKHTREEVTATNNSICTQKWKNTQTHGHTNLSSSDWSSAPRTSCRCPLQRPDEKQEWSEID